MSTEPPTITVTSQATSGSAALTAAGRMFQREQNLPLCLDCAARRERAERWSFDPSLTALWGSPSVVAMRVWAALDALALLDQGEPTSARDVRLAVIHLQDAGAAAQWALRLAPVPDPNAKPDQGTIAPWAHLPVDLLVNTRAAYTTMLAARIDQPTAHAHPRANRRQAGIARRAPVSGVRGRVSARGSPMASSPSPARSATPSGSARAGRGAQSLRTFGRGRPRVLVLRTNRSVGCPTSLNFEPSSAQVRVDLECVQGNRAPRRTGSERLRLGP